MTFTCAFRLNRYARRLPVHFSQVLILLEKGGCSGQLSYRSSLLHFLTTCFLLRGAYLTSFVFLFLLFLRFIFNFFYFVLLLGARGRTRTDTPLRVQDFESSASTIPPLGQILLFVSCCLSYIIQLLFTTIFYLFFSVFYNFVFLGARGRTRTGTP